MLKSGDVQGHAANAEDATALKENCEWIKTLGVHAEHPPPTKQSYMTAHIASNNAINTSNTVT